VISETFPPTVEMVYLRLGSLPVDDVLSFCLPQLLILGVMPVSGAEKDFRSKCKGRGESRRGGQI